MSATAAPRPVAARRGIVGVLGSTDHKTLGGLMFVTAIFFFFAAGLLAITMRTELAAPGLQFLSHRGYNELMTIHGSTMFYLFAVPAALAMGVYLVPLQVGASNIAWPRLAQTGLWMIVVAGVLMWSGFLTVDGAAQAGWYAYLPLSDTANTPGAGQSFWSVGVLLAGLGSLAIAASLLATIVGRRAPGMTMLRMPVFSWTMLVTVLMVLTSFPMLVAAMVLLIYSRIYGGIYSPPSGPILYQHLFWFFGHPVVYVVFFPFVGAALEAIATFSGRRLFGYRIFIFSLLAFAALSMSVWGHHLFTTGTVPDRYFALSSTALLVPAGVEYFDSLATMWRGRIRLTASFLFAIGFLLMFLIGGLTGIWLGSPALNFHDNNSYFIVAHFHYTLFGGSVFGMFAGIYYWFPKVTGVFLRERLGKLQWLLMLVGINLTFFPMFFLGNEGMSRRIADYPSYTGWQSLNEVATAGSYVIFAAMLVFTVNVFLSLAARRPAGPDPWGAHTLEWATSSPPPRHNFAGLPPIRSEAPLLDLREAAEDEGAPDGESAPVAAVEAR